MAVADIVDTGRREPGALPEGWIVCIVVRFERAERALGQGV